MTQEDDLVERLIRAEGKLSQTFDKSLAGQLCLLEAAAEITALREKVEPFERLARDVDAACRDHLGVGLEGLAPEVRFPVGGEAINTRCGISTAALAALLSQPLEEREGE